MFRFALALVLFVQSGYADLKPLQCSVIKGLLGINGIGGELAVKEASAEFYRRTVDRRGEKAIRIEALDALYSIHPLLSKTENPFHQVHHMSANGRPEDLEIGLRARLLWASVEANPRFLLREISFAIEALVYSANQKLVFKDHTRPMDGLTEFGEALMANLVIAAKADPELVRRGIDHEVEILSRDVPGSCQRVFAEEARRRVLAAMPAS